MNNLCENGATCQADSVGGYKCICRDGFEGRYCQGNSNESHCSKQRVFIKNYKDVLSLIGVT